MYKVIDLFAGAGGLSLGFMQTGKFRIVTAIENNKNAQNTYIRNHPDTEILDNVCTADYKHLMQKNGHYDVVIGGPPCQGFSNANRQKKHVISINNRLVKEYVRAVLELKPKAFVLENVGMLRSDIHRFYYSSEYGAEIDKLNLDMHEDYIELLPNDIELPNAIEIISDIKKIEFYLWDEKVYLDFNILFKSSRDKEKFKKQAEKNKGKLLKICSVFTENTNTQEHYDSIISNQIELGTIMKCWFEGKVSSEELLPCIKKAIHIQRMLNKAKELFQNKINVLRYSNNNGIRVYINSYSVYDYIIAMLSNDYEIKSGILNAADFGAPQKRQRFIAFGIKRTELKDKAIEFPQSKFSEDNYKTVWDAISDIQNIPPVFEITEPPIPIQNYSCNGYLVSKLRNSELLYNHIITKSKETALNRFAALEQGQNFHDLRPEMKEDTYSDADRTQNTIYLRLKYSEPSGTVINVRKSMWIHPVHARALSVREAARLQTFPDSFVFEGTKDSQYQQVGNAVPPILAQAIAEKIAELLE